MGIAGTMEWDKSEVRMCPSCLQEQDTCTHVLFCDHAGRVETLRHIIDLMEKWMEEVDTNQFCQTVSQSMLAVGVDAQWPRFVPAWMRPTNKWQ